ncbi:putative Na+/H+ antiporter and related arsenite permease [Desulforapulum autotrophicum HRM2]|uniref:Na+/H+ antiporter and related arsenite permease n=1 Tax=Desulforapulum autotrophicum (strain ATCC 43914 / DSM 3382 / VKM B-1955 / HRM2) TaxID=177437 RepID=C0QFU4_DESAH|nr:putative Na+/H+ antiporter and related arsenite permease [Desulforapulum autotrophicum]ACN15512.1 putative Na+/H+ antiporter and related arsenite permease [Desulforapulum autotrophicum HRM2]
MLSLIVFCSAYIGMALGKIPGLIIDRVGIALLGTIAMVVSGVDTPEDVLKSIDLPTILLLYALMIISAQLRLGGGTPGFHWKLCHFIPIQDCFYCSPWL